MYVQYQIDLNKTSINYHNFTKLHYKEIAMDNSNKGILGIQTDRSVHSNLPHMTTRGTIT
jgi:hypothetical protein